MVDRDEDEDDVQVKVDAEEEAVDETGAFVVAVELVAAAVTDGEVLITFIGRSEVEVAAVDALEFGVDLLFTFLCLFEDDDGSRNESEHILQVNSWSEMSKKENNRSSLSEG